MANMTFNGTQELMAELYREVERLERKATEMLGEGGQVVVKAWQDAIRAAGHDKPGKSKRATGELIRNVRASKPKKNGDVYMSSIYPHGKNARGTRYAEIAFVLNYGTSKIQGDNFVSNAEDRSEEAVQRTMEEVWNRD